MEKIIRLQTIFLSGFALFSCLSTAISNVFLGASSITLFYMLYKNRAIPMLSLSLKKVVKLILLFLAALLLSTLFSDNLLISFTEFFKVYFFRIWPFFLVISNFKFMRKKQLYAIFWSLFGSVIIVSLVVIYQASQGALRPAGFSNNYMYVASYYCSSMPLFLTYCLFKVDKFNLKTISVFISCILCMAGVLVNATRGAWIALFLTGAVILISVMRTYKQYLLTCTIIVGLIMFGVLSNPYYMSRVYSIGDIKNHSNSERLLLWKSSLNMIVDYPVLGVGLGNFAEKYQQKYILPQAKEPDLRHAHNVYLQILSESGIVGFVAYTALFGYLLANNFILFFRKKNIYYLILACTTFSILVQGLTEFNASGQKIYWLVVGWSYLTLSIKERDVEDE